MQEERNESQRVSAQAYDLNQRQIDQMKDLSRRLDEKTKNVDEQAKLLDEQKMTIETLQQKPVVPIPMETKVDDSSNKKRKLDEHGPFY